MKNNIICTVVLTLILSAISQVVLASATEGHKSIVGVWQCSGVKSPATNPRPQIFEINEGGSLHFISGTNTGNQFGGGRSGAATLWAPVDDAKCSNPLPPNVACNPPTLTTNCRIAGLMGPTTPPDACYSFKFSELLYQGPVGTTNGGLVAGRNVDYITFGSYPNASSTGGDLLVSANLVNMVTQFTVFPDTPATVPPLLPMSSTALITGEKVLSSSVNQNYIICSRIEDDPIFTLQEDAVGLPATTLPITSVLPPPSPGLYLGL